MTFFHIRPSWFLPESAATPEDVYRTRRAFIKAAGAGTLVGGSLVGSSAQAGLLDLFSSGDKKAAPLTVEGEPTADLYPFKRNPLYKVNRAITSEKDNAEYNNFYEFGSHKGIWEAAQALKSNPWDIEIDGEVEKPLKADCADLLRRAPREERVYRHRCVEAWAMTVPWSGFPLRHLVEMAKPLSSAKYVRFETFLDKSVSIGQKSQTWYPWPYVEGLTIDEATHDLSFLVTGVYGRPIPKQSGAPIRLALPWKYGFKSIKSISRVTFTSKRPVSFWEEITPKEYGFWANVNPEVPHPRWSQATERILGSKERVPTRKFNGYGEFVASLYSDKKNLGRKLYF